MITSLEGWKTIGLEILQVHAEECGDGSCGCGDQLVSVKIPAKATETQECCEPVCGPEACR